MLEQSDMAHYLLSLGLVKPRDVVEEDLVVVDVSRRNCVFIASTRAGPAFVVKQAGPRSADTLAHEAAVLHALAEMPDMAGKVPAVVHHEPAERGWSCARRPAAATGATIADASPASRRGRSAARWRTCIGSRRTRSSRRPAATGCGRCRSPSRRTS